MEINGATINTTLVNTVTFKPAPNKDVTVKVNNVIVNNNYIHPKSLFKLNGADNIIFEGLNGNSNLTLINNDHNNDGGNHRTVIWLVDNTDNVVIRNLDIAQGNDNAISTFSTGIYSGSNSTIGAVGNNTNTNLKIEGNNFSSRVIQGIYLNNNNISSTGVTINGNTFGKVYNPGIDSKTHNPIYLNGVANFKIFENEIKSVNSTFTAADYRGIYVNGNDGSIYKNTIYDIKRSSSSQTISGIWLKSNVGNSLVNVTVYNNFITDVQTPGSNNDWTGGAYGIVLESGNAFKIYHNSVNLKQQSQTTGISSAFLVINGTNLDVRNNIFNNRLSYTGGGKASIVIINYTATTFAHLDYNNYYAPVIGIRENINSGNYPITTLAAWRTSLGRDTNSTNVQPVFVNENNNLHLVSTGPGATVNVQYLGGTALTNLGYNVPVDIDEDVRYIQRPTMGADEIDETHCGGTVTWNGTSWSPYVLNGVTYQAPPIDWTGNSTLRVVIAGPYTVGNANWLKSCQLEIIADPAAKLVIEENATYIVEDKLTLNNGSIMVVKDKGSFVQVSEPDQNSIHANSTFIVERKSQRMYKLDYTYWASPIKEQSNFTLFNLSPATLASKFYRWSEMGQNWQAQVANQEVMKKGRGYIVRAPQTNNALGQGPADSHTAEFKGAPNNGEITYSDIVGSTTESKWNLIGNPYPSALDVEKFLKDPKNAGKLDGTIYLWTHNTDITSNGNGVSTYSPSDYATYNITGGTKTGKAAVNVGGNNSKPSGYVASGQAFFVKGLQSGAVVFNNAMRVQAPSQNGQFFRPAPTQPVDNWETTGKHRVWLNLSAETGFNQLLVGYIEGATNEKDWGFDGDHFGGNQVSFYSILDSKNMAIQGRALPFNNQDQVPLGYKTTLTGTLKISIDEVDGLFSGQDVYLEDKVLNIVHNLKEAEYAFTTVPGTFNERFVLRYVPAAELGIDNPIVEANSIVVFKNANQISIKSNDQTIEHVTVYDLLGKVIFDKNKINATSFSTAQLNISNQVVIVKVITDTKAEVTKKIMMN